MTNAVITKPAHINRVAMRPRTHAAQGNSAPGHVVGRAANHEIGSAAGHETNHIAGHEAGHALNHATGHAPSRAADCVAKCGHTTGHTTKHGHAVRGSNYEAVSAPPRTRTQTTIPIFFTLDDAYAPWLGVAINSIVRNANPDYHYTLVILHEDLTPEHVSMVKDIVRGTSFDIELVPMAGKPNGIHDRMGNRLRADYFTLTIFFRLFIPEMFPEWDKGIYLDSDVVVPGDISELYDIDLGDNLIGACRDLSIVDIPPFVDYVDNAVGVGIDNYINSGILLMNMKGLREAGLERRFLDVLTTYAFDSVAPDQDYLNVLCHGKIHYLDNAWDTMPAEGVAEDPNPKLIHYNLFMKPWLYDNIPYADYFWKYAASSGFEDEARAFKAAYTDEQRAQDSESLLRMTDRATMITNGENTFASVFNTGKEA